MTGCIASSQSTERQGERERIIQARVQIIRVMTESHHHPSLNDIDIKGNRVLDPLTTDTPVTTETVVTEIEEIITSQSNEVAGIMTIGEEDPVVQDQRVTIQIDQVISRHTNSIKVAVAGAEKVIETELIESVIAEETTTVVAAVTIDAVVIEITKNIIAEAIAEIGTIKLKRTMAKEWLA